MHRATGESASLRGFSSSSRATVDKVDNTTLMQEMAGNMMSNESRTQIECPENYGFTSCNFRADKGADGKIIASSETSLSHIGSNRTHSVAGNLGDRRHRVVGHSEGSAIVHRGNGDDMQSELAEDGMYHSAPQQVRMQLVPSGSGKRSPPAKQGQKQSGSGAGRGAQTKAYTAKRMWLTTEQLLAEEAEAAALEADTRAQEGGAGASSPSANGGGAGKQDDGHSKKTGQNPVSGSGKDSTSYMHIKKDESTVSGKEVKSKLADKKTYHHVVASSDYCGGEKGKDKFSKVLTLAGPAKNVYGCIG